MANFGLLELVLAAGAVWAVFQAGKHYGREQQFKADRLYREAQNETDPERKKQMLLQWNELCDDRHLRKVFKRALLDEKEKPSDKTT